MDEVALRQWKDGIRWKQGSGRKNAAVNLTTGGVQNPHTFPCEAPAFVSEASAMMPVIMSSTRGQAPEDVCMCCQQEGPGAMPWAGERYSDIPPHLHVWYTSHPGHTAHPLLSSSLAPCVSPMAAPACTWEGACAERRQRKAISLSCGNVKVVLAARHRRSGNKYSSVAEPPGSAGRFRPFRDERAVAKIFWIRRRRAREGQAATSIFTLHGPRRMGG